MPAKKTTRKRVARKKTPRRAVPRRQPDAFNDAPHPGYYQPVMDFLSDEAKALLFVIFVMACLLLGLFFLTLATR